MVTYSRAMTGRERLRAYMARQGLKQVDLARELGMSQPGLSRILKGQWRPGLKVAVRIERATGIPASCWVDGKVSSVA